MVRGVLRYAEAGRLVREKRSFVMKRLRRPRGRLFGPNAGVYSKSQEGGGA